MVSQNGSMKMKRISALIVLSFLALQVFSQSAPIKEAKMHLENENFESARKVLNDYIAKNPKDIGEAYYYLGESYYLVDSSSAAKAIWNQALEKDSKSAYNEVGIGKLLLDDKKPVEAQDKFNTAIRHGKSAPAEIYSLVGVAYLNSKNPNPTEAVVYLNKARDANPKNAQYLIQLGDAYNVLNDGGKAMSSYEFASEMDKNNSEVYVKMARIWSRTTQKEQAIAKLEEVISKFPNYAPAYKDLVELYVGQGKYSKVTPLLQKYVQLAGTDLPARKRYVKYLAFQAKDYETTIAEANKVLSEDPNDYTMYRWMGWAYAERKQYQNAYDALTKYFEGLKPTGIEASATEYIYYAAAAANLGKLDEAASAYMKIAILDPTRTDVYDLVAKMYFDAKQYEKAAATYEQKIAKGLGKAADYVTLGRAYYTLKQYTKADSAFTKVNELSPTYVYAYYMRAQAANSIDTANTLHLAKLPYEKIIELSNTDEKFKTDKTYKKYLVEAYTYMGIYTFNELGNATEAIALLDKALAVDPENADVKSYKEQLIKASGANGKGGNKK